MRTAEIWALGQDGVSQPQQTMDPVWLSSAGIALQRSPESASGHGIVLIATRPASGACGVVMVPDGPNAGARLNGVRLCAGIHVADHGDTVTVGPARAWFAVAVAPDRLPYDPDVHGDPVHCLRTKARLAPGDSIVICPGTPQSDCGMKFMASAWSESLPCHHCGALPSDDPWRPPPPADEASLAALLRLGSGA